jgi:hypothetical protein
VNFQLLFHRATFVVATLLVVPSVMGCAKDNPMRASSAVPASEGTIKATTGENGNTDVVILVKHLADPSRVHADATTYVVWFQPREGAIQNMGAMLVDTSLQGRFDGSSPHRQFRVTVTPEHTAMGAYPTHPAVFTSEVELTP